MRRSSSFGSRFPVGPRPEYVVQNRLSIAHLPHEDPDQPQTTRDGDHEEIKQKPQQGVLASASCHSDYSFLCKKYKERAWVSRPIENRDLAVMLLHQTAGSFTQTFVSHLPLTIGHVFSANVSRECTPGRPKCRLPAGNCPHAS